MNKELIDKLDKFVVAVMEENNNSKEPLTDLCKATKMLLGFILINIKEDTDCVDFVNLLVKDVLEERKRILKLYHHIREIQ